VACFDTTIEKLRDIILYRENQVNARRVMPGPLRLTLRHYLNLPIKE
jgi:hypothetical protein